MAFMTQLSAGKGTDHGVGLCHEERCWFPNLAPMNAAFGGQDGVATVAPTILLRRVAAFRAQQPAGPVPSR